MLQRQNNFLESRSLFREFSILLCFTADFHYYSHISPYDLVMCGMMHCVPEDTLHRAAVPISGKVSLHHLIHERTDKKRNESEIRISVLPTTEDKCDANPKERESILRALPIRLEGSPPSTMGDVNIMLNEIERAYSTA